MYSLAGVDQPASDGGGPICDQYGWAYEDLENRMFSAELGYSLLEATYRGSEGEMRSVQVARGRCGVEDQKEE